MDNYRTPEEYIEYQKYAESQEKVLMKSTLPKSAVKPLPSGMGI